MKTIRTTGSHSEPNKMAESMPRKVVPLCWCCNCNIVEANHPIYLYGKKAKNESLLNFLEKLTGYKCDLADRLPSKICRLCYDKTIKFKKLIEVLEKSTVNQRSVLRFKRRKSEADSPSGKSPATRHQRKNKAADNSPSNSEQMAATSTSKVQLFRPILPSTEVYTSTHDEMMKKRVLPRETFPQPPKRQSTEVVELLRNCGLNKPEVYCNQIKTRTALKLIIDT